MHLTSQTQKALDTGFEAAFGGSPQRYFSAPGRTEIGGNHTDHQRGRVLAAAVELDTRGAVRVNDSGLFRVQSMGYPPCTVNLEELAPVAGEENTTQALIRGVAAWFAGQGCRISGLEVYVESTVLPGSGLSSSAAFEVLLGTMLNSLFFGNRASREQVALAGQFAEREYFGKPCGLMDQLASALGGLTAMDFGDENHPRTRTVPFDFSGTGYALCIVDTRASHADLTEEYGAIPREMGEIAGYFGKNVLTQVEESDFYREIPALRASCGDRAVLRAIHFFHENRRAAQEAEALEAGDFPGFLELVRESGRSSCLYLQNVIPAGAVRHQEAALTLALCEALLGGEGACRIHGGGFAGTVQAFVPEARLAAFRDGIQAVLGPGACHVLTLRPQGGTEMVPLMRA